MELRIKNSRLIPAIILSAFFSMAAVFADTPIPELTSPVMDTAGVLSESAKTELEQYLSAVNSQTSVQIALFTVNSLNEETIESLSMRAAQKWKLGQEGKDNGVILTVAMEERELRIEVGYGLEGVLTDAKCGLIIRKFIVPYFQDGNYEEGIQNGIKIITGYATDNAEIKSQVDATADDDSYEAPVISIIMFFIFLLIITSQFGAGPFGILFFWSLLTGRPFTRRYSNPNRIYRGTSGHDDFHHRGGFGGSGGGGFHGGGGGFGGGGASGRW